MNNRIAFNNKLQRLFSLTLALAAWMVLAVEPANAAGPKKKPPEKTPAPSVRAGTPCTSVEAVPGVVNVTQGKYARIKTPGPVARFLVFPTTSAAALPALDKPQAPPARPQAPPAEAPPLLVPPPAAPARSAPGVAEIDVVLLSPQEIFVLGKTVGSTQIVLQAESGQCALVDVAVVMDTAALQGKLGQLLPDEKNIKVNAAADSLILSGTVSDAVKVNTAVALAGAYVGGEKKIINMLNTGSAQQVMLEVKVAEIQKNLLDKLGMDFRLERNIGDTTYRLLSLFGTTNGGVLDILTKSGKTSLVLDAEKRDGLIKILAEPTIMAVSGQSASFRAGGKIFIPVARANDVTGATTITLEEKEFGVGLTFTPTVLEGGRINLVVGPEVSELSQTGTPFTTVGGVTAVLPSFTLRKASTTVQLKDGQSFAIAGLIKNNVTETVRRFPILGEIPILGALFRSSEFQDDKTELVFVVTPRLVKPLPPDYKLPTDGFIEPSRSEFFLEGRMEGRPKEPAAGGESSQAPAQQPAQQPAPQSDKPGGFQMK